MNPSETHSPYVNYDAIKALDTEELVRSLNEDGMPSEQYDAMWAELQQRCAAEPTLTHDLAGGQ